MPGQWQVRFGALAVVVSAVLHAAPWVESSSAFEYTQVHMGIPVRIVLYAADETSAMRAATAAFARIGELDRAMSDYRPDSDIREVARRAPAAVPVAPDVFRAVTRAIEIARATDGAFDPTVAPLVELWRDARATSRLPPPAAIARARALVGWRRVELDAARVSMRLPVSGMRIDLGGLGKGYILQAALDTLRSVGVRSALIEAGGDIVVGDAPPGRAGWRIEIPASTQSGGDGTSGISGGLFRRAATLSNAALATSGASVQFVEIDGIRYSHVVDPRTGQALTTSVTAHVIAPDGATADALATAATVIGERGLATLRARFPEALIHLGMPVGLTAPLR
ncbi:MAG: FAD:protein FMN transferase [Acidobacteria bacterium]|nr:FAD:protein FMN transferase [Acidobacteriota bacterium]